MIIEFVKNAFIQWLSTNRQQFNHPPCNIQFCDHHISFNLTGITQVLSWSLSESGAFLSVCYENDLDNDDMGVFWDGLADFDIGEEYSVSGEYYCDLCEGQPREYFPTKLALWEDHFFEPILTWSNQHITTNKVLVLSRQEGMTWAELIDQSEWKEKMQKPGDYDCVYKVIPVLATA